MIGMMLTGSMLANSWAPLCRNLPQKVGNALTEEEYREVKELGILVDKDDQAGALFPSAAIYAYILNDSAFFNGIRPS